MSSFPQHEDNVQSLVRMGFDMSDCLDEDGNVTLESWCYDELVDLVSHIVNVLDKEGFTCNDDL